MLDCLIKIISNICISRCTTSDMLVRYIHNIFYGTEKKRKISIKNNITFVNQF